MTVNVDARVHLSLWGESGKIATERETERKFSLNAECY